MYRYYFHTCVTVPLIPANPKMAKEVETGLVALGNDAWLLKTCWTTK